MGQGINLAAQDNTEHAAAAAIDNMKDQPLIVLIKKLGGGSVEVPVSEVDDTSQDTLLMSVDPHTRMFKFVVGKKQ